MSVSDHVALAAEHLSRLQTLALCAGSFVSTVGQSMTGVSYATMVCLSLALH